MLGRRSLPGHENLRLLYKLELAAVEQQAAYDAGMGRGQLLGKIWDHFDGAVSPPNPHPHPSRVSALSQTARLSSALLCCISEQLFQMVLRGLTAALESIRRGAVLS